MPLTQMLGGALDDAAKNHHLVPTAALLAKGLTYRQISRLARHGVLDRIIRGLYRVPGTRGPVQDVAAALSRHRNAVASHLSALFLHGFDVRPPDRPHFTMPANASGATTLGRLHRSPLDPADITRRHRLPVTTVARALVDASEMLVTRRLAELLDEAICTQKTTIREVVEAMERAERAPGRLGLGRAREALRPWLEAIEPESPAEAAAIRRIIEHGLPAPVTQHTVTDDSGAFVARVDLAWPDHRVIREYDSIRYHGPSRVEADELRRRRIEALGWTIGAIERRHLRPGQTAWLEDLARDLRIQRLSSA